MPNTPNASHVPLDDRLPNVGDWIVITKTPGPYKKAEIANLPETDPEALSAPGLNGEVDPQLILMEKYVGIVPSKYQDPRLQVTGHPLAVMAVGYPFLGVSDGEHKFSLDLREVEFTKVPLDYAQLMHQNTPDFDFVRDPDTKQIICVPRWEEPSNSNDKITVHPSRNPKSSTVRPKEITSEALNAENLWGPFGSTGSTDSPR